MKLQPSAIVKKLFLQGTIVTINQEIDFEKAEEIAMEYDVLCEKEKKINVIEPDGFKANAYCGAFEIWKERLEQSI